MIISYANGNSAGKYYYKELIEGTKRYRTKLIKGAGTLKQAEELAGNSFSDERRGTSSQILFKYWKG